MKYLVSLNLKDRPCLVVGGGRVATRKISYLQECEASLVVLAPCFSDVLEKQRGQLRLMAKKFEEKDLEGFFLVIAATNDSELNDEIAELCHKRGILVNNVSNSSSSSFSNLARFCVHSFLVGVTSLKGAQAKKSVKFSQKLKKLLEGEYE